MVSAHLLFGDFQNNLISEVKFIYKKHLKQPRLIKVLYNRIMSECILCDMAFRTSDSTSEKQVWEIPAVIATVRWNDPDDLGFDKSLCGF